MMGGHSSFSARTQLVQCLQVVSATSIVTSSYSLSSALIADRAMDELSSPAPADLAASRHSGCLL
jgi:hypothetical protein